MSTPTHRPLSRPNPIFFIKLRTFTRTRLLNLTVADHTRTLPAATRTANLPRHHHHPTTATTILIPVLTLIQTPTTALLS